MTQFNNILSVIDPEQKGLETVVAQAENLAKAHQATVSYLTVIEEPRSWHAFFQDKKVYKESFLTLTEKKRNDLEQVIKKINPSKTPKVQVICGIGFIEIIKEVVRNKHDLLVKCSEDNDWVDRMFGSEDMHILRKCPCPVLMLAPGKTDGFKNILATVDVTDDIESDDEVLAQDSLNKLVMDYSISVCVPELSELHVCSVWEAYAESFLRHSAFGKIPEDDVENYVEKTRKQYTRKLNKLMEESSNNIGKDTFDFLKPKEHFIKGKPSVEIPLLAAKQKSDLVVMGTVGRVGVPGLIIGNTAESILEQVHCSVLAIKPVGFKTPVI